VINNQKYGLEKESYEEYGEKGTFIIFHIKREINPLCCFYSLNSMGHVRRETMKRVLIR
jgi:hypothetical protein